jgi:voltage-gated potassium channel
MAAADKSQGLATRAYLAFRAPIALFAAIHIVGAGGFWIISDGKASLLDCIYMVFITVASIGYGEIVDLSHSPAGRVFNMAVALVGIATVGYMMSKLTAFILETELNEDLRRKRMRDRIAHLSGHYILCGVGRVGSNVAHELAVTRREFVGVDDSQESLGAFREHYPNALYLHGDSSDDDLLLEAGVERAAGLFAVTGDDGKNLMITLTAKQLNPAVRVVARCHEVRNMEKLRRVGADAIVSPDFTGGMRIASSMIRPTVVGFLDEMLRSDERLRVEEVVVPGDAPPRPLGELVPASRDYVLLALRTGGGLAFNPRADFVVSGGDAIVVMAHLEGRMALEKRVAG